MVKVFCNFNVNTKNHLGMFQSLRIAIQKQKRLLAIFLLTIFLPALALGIFGITALRNEKFRQVKQIENEQARLMNDFKGRINSRFNAIANRIESLSGHPAVLNKEYAVLTNLLRLQTENNPLAEQIIVLYPNEDPFFPLFQNGLSDSENVFSETIFSNTQLNIIQEAENFEFQQKNYTEAISCYNQLLNGSESPAIRAYALNRIARVCLKTKNYAKALEVNKRIVNDFESKNLQENLPFFLYARLNMVECYLKTGEREKAVTTALDFYNELLGNQWNLSEEQFHAYTGIVKEKITELLNADNNLKTTFGDEMRRLEERYKLKTLEWQDIRTIKSEVIPDLLKYIQNNSPPTTPFRWSKSVGEKDYLILAAPFKEENNFQKTGLLAVTLNQRFLENELLENEIENSGLFMNTSVHIMDLTGRSITGQQIETKNSIHTTGFFDNYFPPWQIELWTPRIKAGGNSSLFSNFFFWTIITLIIILAFGTALIIRIIGKEMELLKVKSDFVSSVSHEFKTPLTSMKALTERLQEGKVTRPEKLKQYVSFISFDIDRLIRLVGNILNFAKIEEGQKQYKFEQTDATNWLKQVVSDFIRENFESDIDIQTQIPNQLPAVFIDRDAMTQALFNLLDNAVRFSPAKKELALTVQQEKNRLVIKIKDKGMGIAKDETTKIFEKFYRGNAAVNHSIKGTGLGLTLVKYTVEAHKGQITLNSEPGWSTVFAVKLPVENIQKGGINGKKNSDY